jgi:hypothetical protein
LTRIWFSLARQFGGRSFLRLQLGNLVAARIGGRLDLPDERGVVAGCHGVTPVLRLIV